MAQQHASVRVTGQSRPLWSRPRDVWDHRQILGLLVKRDLSVRYAESVLGYLWSLLDPLLMAVVYWFVFTRIFDRTVGHEPYVIFVLVALLPWTWFQNCVGDSSHALQSESRLARSTALPRELWAMRIVLSKGVEFLYAIPVLLLLVFLFRDQITTVHLPYLWVFGLAIVVQVILLTGCALLLSPLTVLLQDIDPLVKVALRFGFYVSPIIYGITDIGVMGATDWMKQAFMLNPMTGIIAGYRAALFPQEFTWSVFGTAAAVSIFILVLGQFTFSRLERDVLKEL